MAVLEEKMKQGTTKLVQLVVQEETPDQIALREACDAYIVQACDRIRQDMEREKAANHVRYDVPNAASGEETNPHYLVHWGAEFDVNFKKKEKFYGMFRCSPANRSSTLQTYAKRTSAAVWKPTKTTKQ